MLAIIVSGHGDLAQSLLRSAEMIFGKAPQVTAISLTDHESVEELRNQYELALQKFPLGNDLLFLVDLWGGSPFNAAQPLIAADPLHRGLLAGLNLPMLIEAMASQEQRLAEVLPRLEQAARGSIRRLDLTTPFTNQA